MAGIWQTGSGRPVQFWDGKRNVKRKTFGVSVECLEIHRVVWPRGSSTRLSIYSRMYSRFNCHCVSVDPARSAASRSEKSSSRNNYGPIVTGPDLHQTTTQYPIRKRNRNCICHLFFRLCPAARDDIRTWSLLAWASYLDSCRIVSRRSIIDASCRLFDIDVHKCILSSR